MIQPYKKNSESSLVTQDPAFKKCSLCDFEWKTREEFLKDPGIELIGYQVNFKNPAQGLFLFNHSCKGTLAIRADIFLDLYDGPVFKSRLTNTDKCTNLCLYEDQLEPCPAECECAYIRDLMQSIKKQKK